MRRSFIISSVLAATAVLGACSSAPANNGGTNVNVKPAVTATPAGTATPIASPISSPVASPGKDVKGNVKVETPKTTPTIEKKPVETPKK